MRAYSSSTKRRSAVCRPRTAMRCSSRRRSCRSGMLRETSISPVRERRPSMYSRSENDSRAWASPLTGNDSTASREFETREHYYTNTSKKALQGLIADAFIVVRNFVTVELQEDPLTLLGDETGQPMLEVNEVHEAERE